MGDKDGKMGFGDIREALDGGAYLYDRASGTLWHTEAERGCAEVAIQAARVDEADVRERIASGVPLPSAKDDGVERLLGDWGVYGDGRQPYYGMTAGERLVRICQMAAGSPGRWVLLGEDGEEIR